ncbi:MAG: helix-turn-helix domain-containing protein, partial [Gemmatimonadaceae bacterium]
HYRGILTGIPEFHLESGRVDHTGLTSDESAVLDTLVRVGDASRDVLAERLGLRPTDLGVTLKRLEALGYAAPSDDGNTIRAIAQDGGQPL